MAFSGYKSQRKAMTKEEETKNNQRTQTGEPEDKRRANGERTQHRGTEKKKREGNGRTN
jgi:hypothetical protein